MRLSSVLLSLLLVLPSAALAEPAQDATIRRFLALTEAREKLAPVLRPVIDDQVAQEVMKFVPVGAGPDAIYQVFSERSPAIRAALEKELSYERFEAEVIRIYAAAFTEDELAVLVRLYETPHGKEALQKAQAVQLSLVNLLPRLLARASATLAPPLPPAPPPLARPANACDDVLSQLGGYRLGPTAEAFFADLPGFSPTGGPLQGLELFRDYKTFDYHDSDNIYRKTAVAFQYYQGAVFGLSVLRMGSRPEMEGHYQRALATVEGAPRFVRQDSKSVWDGRENVSQVRFLCDGRYSLELRFAELRPHDKEMGVFTMFTTIEDDVVRQQLATAIGNDCPRQEYRAYPLCAHR